MVKITTTDEPGREYLVKCDALGKAVQATQDYFAAKKVARRHERDAIKKAALEAIGDSFTSITDRAKASTACAVRDQLSLYIQADNVNGFSIYIKRGGMQATDAVLSA